MKPSFFSALTVCISIKNRSTHRVINILIRGEVITTACCSIWSKAAITFLRCELDECHLVVCNLYYTLHRERSFYETKETECTGGAVN